MWLFGFIDSGCYSNAQLCLAVGLLTAFFCLLVGLILTLLASLVRKSRHEDRLRKYLGPNWREDKKDVDKRLKEHDEWLDGLYFNLNAARSMLQSSDITDDERSLRFQAFKTRVKYVDQGRKKRDTAYSLAFDPKVGRGEVAEARIRAGQPRVTQELSTRTSRIPQPGEK